MSYRAVLSTPHTGLGRHHGGGGHRGGGGHLGGGGHHGGTTFVGGGYGPTYWGPEYFDVVDTSPYVVVEEPSVATVYVKKNNAWTSYPGAEKLSVDAAEQLARNLRNQGLEVRIGS